MIEDVRQDTALSPGANGSTNAVNGTGAAEDNSGGGGGVNGKKEGTNGTAANNSNNSNAPSLAVPKSVVEEALIVTRESLEAVCEVDESGTT